ncbi:MAG: NAD(P)H-hydrate dehydratase, partial [Candidatus Dormibacteria bacterium]
RLPAFRDVEISVDAQGAPRVCVRGWTSPVTVSLSHEGDWAVAVAVAGGAASSGGDTATRPGPLPGALSPPLLMVPPSVRLPDRPADAHKGTFGTVLVVGGAPGFSGAPHMAAMGAARGGAGLVRVAVPPTIHDQVAARSAEIMVQPITGWGEGRPENLVAEDMLALAAGAAALVVGPGMTTVPVAARSVQALLDRLPCPAVVDADGLNIVAQAGFLWRRCPQPVVVTPHPAEMARLTGIPVVRVQADRAGVAGAYAAQHGVVVVLKGSGTVIAGAGGRIHVAAAGVVALATGGTGDVLTGVIASLIAQGLEPFDAAVAGVTIHAEAGAAVQAVRGRAGALAGDLIEQLPAAQERVRRAIEAVRGPIAR